MGFADPRLKVIHQANEGLGAARNRTLRESSGRFVTFLDSDDLLTPAALELMRRAADVGKADIVSAVAQTLGKGGDRRVIVRSATSLVVWVMGEMLPNGLRLMAGRFTALCPLTTELVGATKTSSRAAG